MTAKEKVKGLSSVAGVCVYLKGKRRKKKKKVIFWYNTLDMLPTLPLFQWLVGSLPMDKMLQCALHSSSASEL